MKIYLATNNKHKKEEFQRIFDNHTIVTPDEENIEFECEETGLTYAENSLLKAKTLYDIVKQPVLADDSGLSVCALDGAPGLYSARFGNSDDVELSAKEQYELVLEKLRDETDREAFFVCNLTLILNDYKIYSIQETFDGSIADKAEGTNGFGYDPIFYVPKYDCTLANVSSEIKDSISHRAIAANKMKLLLNGENNE